MSDMGTIGGAARREAEAKEQLAKDKRLAEVRNLAERIYIRRCITGAEEAGFRTDAKDSLLAAVVFFQYLDEVEGKLGKKNKELNPETFAVDPRRSPV